MCIGTRDPTFSQIEAANVQGGDTSDYVGDMCEDGDSVLSSFVWRLNLLFAEVVADVAAGSTEAQYYGISFADGCLF